MGQRRRRHTPEQIIRKLREADRLLGEGQDVRASHVAPCLAIHGIGTHHWSRFAKLEGTAAGVLYERRGATNRNAATSA